MRGRAEAEQADAAAAPPSAVGADRRWSLVIAVLLRSSRRWRGGRRLPRPGLRRPPRRQRPGRGAGCAGGGALVLAAAVRLAVSAAAGLGVAPVRCWRRARARSGLRHGAGRRPTGVTAPSGRRLGLVRPGLRPDGGPPGGGAAWRAGRAGSRGRRPGPGPGRRRRRSASRRRRSRRRWPRRAAGRRRPDPAIVPVVQVKNFISAGSVSTDSSSITKPISTVRGLPPEPIMVNAVAYTAAAAGL